MRTLRERSPALPLPKPQPDAVVVRTTALSKRYGVQIAVDRLDLEIRAGEVFGLLGPNGSGKSTTLGMLLGLIAPTSGRIEIFGQELATAATLPRQTGGVIESPSFYPKLTGRENLDALALAVGGIPARRIAELVDLVGLDEWAGRQVHTYSLGMKQRLGIAAALLTDPALVILDEPTNGLDPAGQREVRHLIPDLARQGRAVLLASHLLHEVEQVCDRVTILRRGVAIETGWVDELLRRGGFLEITIDEPLRAKRIIERLPFVDDVSLKEGRLEVVAAEEHSEAINRALTAEHLFASLIVPRRNSLEDIFLELTEAAPSPNQHLEPRRNHHEVHAA